MNQTRATVMGKLIEILELNKFKTSKDQKKNIQLVEDTKKILALCEMPEEDLNYALTEVEYFFPHAIQWRDFFKRILLPPS